MSTDLEVTGVQMDDDGTNLILKITLSNPTGHTLHAYSTPRKILYDEAAKKLTVHLTDRESTGGTAGMMVHPKMRAVDPKDTMEMTVTLPRILTRLAASPGAPAQSAKMEQLPIYEAQSVDVLVGWSDQPFYPDQRPASRNLTAKEQLVNWEKGVARGSSSAGGRKGRPKRG